MNLVSFSVSPLEASLTGYLSNATGATWTLSVTTANDNLAHLATIRNDSVTNHSAKTALITGTDPDGNVQTETVSLPNTSATVTGTKYFKTISTIVPSATIGADTMDLGWAVTAVSRSVPLNYLATPFSVSLATIKTGTVNYGIQHTFQDIYTDYPSTLTWFDHEVIATVAVSADSNYAFPARATRLLINSVTNGATLRFVINQGK